MTSLLAQAIVYAGRGRPVFPVGKDKKPLTEHGFKDATTDEATIRRWWAGNPGSDPGIATPTGPGWFVLDVDDEAALAALQAEHGQLPPTVEVITPRPGRHIYLRGEGVTNSAGGLAEGIDIRGVGGYVVLPPTTGYEWRTAPDEIPLAFAPSWLMKLLTTGTRNGAPVVEAEIATGRRNTTLASMAGTMRRRGFSEAAIEAALLIENRDRCRPPLPEREVRRIAHSIARYAPYLSGSATVHGRGQLPTAKRDAELAAYIRRREDRREESA